MLKRLSRHPFVQKAAVVLLRLYLGLVYRTTRWELLGLDGGTFTRPPGGPVILAFWHERLPLAALGWRLAAARLSDSGGRRAQVLISRHRDGRLIADIVRPIGIDVVHASSSKGGATGLRTMLRILAGGGVAVITPDGPRGPARQAALGVAQLAAVSGVPVLPCAVATTRMKLARSWDRMRIPLPFSRGYAVVGAPVPVAREAAEAALPLITAALNDACARADALAGGRAA